MKKISQFLKVKQILLAMLTVLTITGISPQVGAIFHQDMERDVDRAMGAVNEAATRASTLLGKYDQDVEIIMDQTQVALIQSNSLINNANRLIDRFGYVAIIFVFFMFLNLSLLIYLTYLIYQINTKVLRQHK